MFFYKFYLRSFKTEKGVKYFPPTTLEKNLRPSLELQGLNFSSLSPKWHFPNWHFPELVIPQLALFAIFFCYREFASSNYGTPSYFNLYQNCLFAFMERLQFLPFLEKCRRALFFYTNTIHIYESKYFPLIRKIQLNLPFTPVISFPKAYF